MTLDQFTQNGTTTLTQRIEHYDFQRNDIDNREMNSLTFVGCRFDRSSITCVRARNSTFIACQFLNADVLSCNFTECAFEDCDFSLANICDNTFNKCIFKNTVFTGATLRTNEFFSVSFAQISLCGSVTSLNAFRHAIIENSEFGNCTVDYNILEDCSFHQSTINIESFGTFWGLSPTMLNNASFLSLGELLEEKTVDRVAILARREFEEERRFIELFVLDVNLSLCNLLDATVQLGENIKNKVLRGDYLPADQLTFLFNIFKELYRRKQLGFLVLHEFRSSIGDILQSVSVDYKFYENFILLYNNLNLLYQSLIADLEILNDWGSLETDRKIVVKLHFETKPTVSIPALLEACYQFVYDTPLMSAPIILDERAGSYIMFLETTVKTILALNVCCLSLVGTIKYLIQIRANISVLTSKKLPRKYYLAVTKPDTEISLSQAIASLVVGLTKKILPGILKNSIHEICEDNLKDITEIADNTDNSSQADKKH